METRPNLDGQQNNTGLNSIEIDTIGEILNISMGAAATAVSILLNRQVSITTPSVQVVFSSEFEFSELEPALGIEIKYIQGLFGSNQMIMSVKDIRSIVQLLLGEEFGALSDGTDTPLDEIHVSALGEVMNQMMGASCTALASFLDREINISPPAPFELTGLNGKLWAEKQELIVAVGFKLTIEDLVDSEFFTVMPVPFAKELVNSAMGFSGQESVPEVSEVTQVTGHTQVPVPVIGDDYQAPKAMPKSAPIPSPIPGPIPGPEPVPKPAAKPAPAAAKPAPLAAPLTGPVAAPKPVPAQAVKPVPETVPKPVADIVPEPVTAQMFDPEPAEVYYPESAEMFEPEPLETPAPAVAPRPAPVAAARPAPAAVQRPAAAQVPRTIPAAAANPASPRSVPAGGYAQDRAAQPKNVVVKPLQFGNLDMMDAFSDEIDTVNLGLVMGVDLNVTVEIGRTRKQVKEILSLRQGSIVELDKQAGAPVDIMVNGKLIARGDVVVIDDNFGVRITEIVSGTAQK